MSPHSADRVDPASEGGFGRAGANPPALPPVAGKGSAFACPEGLSAAGRELAACASLLRERFLVEPDSLSALIGRVAEQLKEAESAAAGQVAWLEAVRAVRRENGLLEAELSRKLLLLSQWAEASGLAFEGYLPRGTPLFAPGPGQPSRWEA